MKSIHTFCVHSLKFALRYIRTASPNMFRVSFIGRPQKNIIEQGVSFASRTQEFFSSHGVTFPQRSCLLRSVESSVMLIKVYVKSISRTSYNPKTTLSSIFWSFGKFSSIVAGTPSKEYHLQPELASIPLLQLQKSIYDISQHCNLGN